MTFYRSTSLETGVQMAYAEAGDSSKPTLLLLHGFPSSSHQYRNLIPLLSDRFHIIAPDLPTFGLTVVPENFQATFAALTDAVTGLLDALQISSFIPYVFDYGAPVAYRLALQRPKSFAGLIVQNGNAYEEGLSQWWDPLRKFWKTEKGTEDWHKIREQLRDAVDLEQAKSQYTSGLSSDLISQIDPNAYHLDFLLNMSSEDKVNNQLDLFYDYQHNVALYPEFQKFFRESQLKTLILWGKNDIYFPPTGAVAYEADLKDTKLRIFDDGSHFLLETHVVQVAEAIKDFLPETGR
ncbi:uncharacterized protein IL334_004515 [Kwoniella shivajii]|uniref:AB hydrolase-1 domain-containing protein n=1 Tax=Kwoniella shivajii TaxID=564305 RepID=A0ABZ1D157_9TREE|nr:hypothetical protein IL334_004515 [Kwoniella shivajii]